MSSTASLSSSLSMSTSTPSTIVTSSAVDPTGSLRPYVCNWISADHYCGKRFTSSEELLQHLRTHTSLSSSVPVVTSSAVGGGEPLSSPSYQHHHQLLNPSLHPHSAHLLAALAAAAAALHRTYPTPPLSPLSMARYHPYGSGGKHLATVSPAAAAVQQPSPTQPPNNNSSNSNASPLLSLHHPYAAAASLAGYYPTHPYSLYSQRMLAGAGVLP